MSSTDTNQASELAELCKKVYEKTGWIVGDESWEWHTTTDAKLDSMFIAPKYYTDYLLEKLPEWTRVQKIGNDTGKYSASYELDYTTSLGDTALVGSSDTPLNALLKLTIALSEAGELNDQPS